MKGSSASPFYGPELSRIHQEGYEEFVGGLAPRMLRLLRKGGIRRGHVVDLACGAGGWAQELSRSGYRVTGIDISREMIRLARRRVRDARFVRGSMVTAKLPPCEAVTATGEAFNYLLRDGEVRRVFRRVHAALRPGGLFFFDATLPAGPRTRRRTHLRLEKDWAILVMVEERSGRRLTRTIKWWRRHSRGIRRGTEIHRQKLRSSAVLLRWLGQSGFRARLEPGAGARNVLVVAQKIESGTSPRA